MNRFSYAMQINTIPISRVNASAFIYSHYDEPEHRLLINLIKFYLKILPT